MWDGFNFTIATVAEWVEFTLKTVFKLCSRRCLKPSHNRVSNFTPLGRWQLKKLFRAGLTNFKVFLWKDEIELNSVEYFIYP